MDSRTTRARVEPVGVALLLALGFVPGLVAQDAQRIDFEDLKAGSRQGAQVVIRAEYSTRGVTFNAPVLLVFPNSRSNAIEHCVGQSDCRTPFIMKFDNPQSRVRVLVGYSEQDNESFDVILEAFDETGRVVGSDNSHIESRDEVVPIGIELVVSLSTPQIVSARTRLADGRDGIPGLAMDDIEFDAVTHLADLEISELTSVAEPDRVEVLVVNAGNVNSGATQVVLTDGEVELARSELPALAPEQSTVVVLTPATRPARGTHRLRVALDPADAVKEVNENNNSAVVDLVVPGLPWPEILAAAALASGVIAYGVQRARKVRLVRALARVRVATSADPGSQSIEEEGPAKSLPHVALRFRIGEGELSVDEPPAQEPGF